jgi:hypothetical protein
VPRERDLNVNSDIRAEVVIPRGRLRRRKTERKIFTWGLLLYYVLLIGRNQAKGLGCDMLLCVPWILAGLGDNRKCASVRFRRGYYHFDN